MKLTVAQSELRVALSTVGRAVPTKATHPVLSFVLAQAEGGQLRLTGTNLERAIGVELEADVDEPGAIVLDHARLAGWVGSLAKDSPVCLSSGTKGRARIEAPGTHASIATRPVEDFPESAVGAPEAASLDAGQLKTELRRVVYAIARNDTRPVLAGAHVCTLDGELIIEAADGYRLARSRSALSGTVADLDLLVPRATVVDLVRLLPDAGTVEIGLAKNRGRAVFRSERVDIITRLVDGQYPDVTRVIPATPTTTTEVDGAELIRLAKPACLFADMASSPSITLEFRPDGPMGIRAHAREIGEYAAELAATTTGGALEVDLNGHYLIEAIEALGGEQVMIACTEPGKPVVFWRALDPLRRAISLLMPMVAYTPGGGGS